MSLRPSKVTTYKKLFAVVSLLLSSMISFGQRIKVVSASDEATLPYATILNRSTGRLTSCDANGLAYIPANINDTLAVSYVGFKTAIFQFLRDSLKTVQLKPDDHMMSPVMIYSCKSPKKLTLQSWKGKRQKLGYDKCYFGGFALGRHSSFNTQMAVRVKTGLDHAWLKTFSFFITSDDRASASALQCPILFWFYAVDSLRDLPGAPLIETPVVYVPRKAGLQKLSLDSLRLHIPSSGIFIGIQYLQDDKYQWDSNFVGMREDGTIFPAGVYCRLGLTLGGTVSKEFPLVSNWGPEGKWTTKNSSYPCTGGLPATLKCSVTVTHCQNE